ncbi:unnamed protein product [Calicophoron daubneyi]|uniref:Protein arginine methyltransferase NDUFAF7 n=1 Tax=Calicophoron daubneyi TaxID=300641 RepID=A0AAV2TKQ7_CALDB
MILRSCRSFIGTSWRVGRTFCTGQLEKTLVDRILHFGPITVADFMKECLINPAHGYYMNSDVFGKEGDFTTSPEICQIFGELVGIWLVNEYNEQGKPSHLQIAEFGPGRGTLLADVIRVFARFPSAYSSVSLHLVEVSPKMRAIQQKTIEQTIRGLNLEPPPISWHLDFEDVPRGLPTFFIAHEFLDALPVHQFRKYDGKWAETLVGVITETDGTGSNKLCFVRSPRPTVAQTAYLPLLGDINERDCVEICPKALVFIDEVCQRVGAHKGGALIIDYGHLGEKGDTFRGFSRHEVCDPLTNPGKIDLTCDVDFSLLSQRAKSSGCKVDVHGPETQAYFLINMGLLTRLRNLMLTCSSEKRREELLSGCEMLITAEQMGSRFKFLAIVPHSAEKRRLPGFTDLPGTPYYDQRSS